jgi:CheY-like chemotaxis protein
MPHKLLLADDSVTIQRVIELTFADEDVQVIAVGNGQQAIERAERDRPDIVLADVGMPERDGYEVAAFIKGSPTLSHVPVVLLTGAFEPIDETRARAVGCDGVLVKPFEPQMVISRVKDLLAGKRPAELWGGGPAAHGPLRPATPVPDLRAPAASASTSDPLEAYFDRLDAAFSSIGGATGEAAAPAPPPPPAPARQAIPLSRASASDAQPLPPEGGSHKFAGGSHTFAAQPAHAPEGGSHRVAAAHAAPPKDDLAAWDPDIEGDPLRPAAPVAAAPAPPPAAAAPRAGSANPLEAFFGTLPAAPPPPPPPAPAAAAPAPAMPAPAMPVPTPPPAAVPLQPAPPASAPAGVAAPPPSLVDAFAALLAAEQRMPLAASGAAIGSARVSEDVIEDITRRVLDRLADHTVRPTVLDLAERLVREEIDRIKQQAH